MAASVYKWFSIFFLAIGLTAAKPASFHPFHVSVTEIEHNEGDKTLEISCKIFTDDFENILSKNYRTRVDLINPKDKAAMDTLVKKYILSHLTIRANGKPVVMNYLGYENEKEAAYGYIEVSNVTSVSKLEIYNSILHDKFDDQVNIMHVKVKGERKSTKLDYPNKEATLTW